MDRTMPRERPNLILITTDAQRWNAYGFQNPDVQTPHMDWLAKRGVRFQSCVVPHVLCQPARASILTGKLPLSNGVYDNGIDLKPEIGEQGFAGQLSRSGYDTRFIGKAHFASRRTFDPTNTPGNQHEDSTRLGEWNGPYMGFDQVELAVNGHNLADPARPPIGLHYERWYYGDGLGDLKNELHVKKLPPFSEAPMTWNSALPPAWHNATWVADRAIENIRQSKGSPFCHWISFADPHPPFDAPNPWCFMYRPENITLPKHLELTTDDRPWWHSASIAQPNRIYDDERMNDDKRHVGFTRLAPSDPTQIQEVLANYYGSVSLVDHNVGRILNALHELDIYEDTIIIFTSDHGFFLGEHGLFLQNPMLYEPLTRVSMVCHGFGVPEDVDFHLPVSTIDIGATFLDLANVDSSALTHSRSLVPAMNDDRQGGPYRFLEWDVDNTRYCLGREARLRLVRTATHKLIIDENTGEGELYDLENDPDEVANLFDDKAHAALRDELIVAIENRGSDLIVDKQARVGYY